MKLVSLIILIFLSLPGYCQEEDEKFFKELEADRNKQMGMAVKANEAKEQSIAISISAGEELKALGYSTINSAALFDKKVQAVLKKALANNPMQYESREKVRETIMAKVKGKPLEKILLRFPKLVEIFVDIMRDREAMPGLVGIFGRKADLKLYFVYWLCLMLLGVLVKWIFFRKHWSFFKRTFLSITLSLIVTATSLTVFYNMFKPELKPSVDIIRNHF